MSKRRGGFGKFLLGAAIGVGAGMLFSPKKGEENRKDLAKKIDELKDEAKKIDVEELKIKFQDKILELQDELEDLDQEKALDLAEKHGKKIKKKAEELYALAVEKGTPVMQDAAEALRQKAVVVTKDVLKRLEAAEVKEEKTKKSEK